MTPDRYALDDDVEPGEVFLDVDPATGYELIRERGAGGAAHHRILAYAWGLIDGLDDPHEVDHIREVRTLNIEPNLRALDPEEHGRRTRRRERARKTDADSHQTALDAFGPADVVDPDAVLDDVDQPALPGGAD